MNPDAETRRVILDSLAAIDLISELMGDQRRSLEAALRRDWPPVPNAPSSLPASKHRSHHRKGPATTLSIKIDGQTIEEPRAVAGMVGALEFIGIPLVESLGLRLGGQPLIVGGTRPAGRGYHRCGERWIATHSDTAEKRDALKEICRRLGLSCSIQQVPRPPSGSL